MIEPRGARESRVPTKSEVALRACCPTLTVKSHAAIKQVESLPPHHRSRFWSLYSQIDLVRRMTELTSLRIDGLTEDGIKRLTELPLPFALKEFELHQRDTIVTEVSLHHLSAFAPTLTRLSLHRVDCNFGPLAALKELRTLRFEGFVSDEDSSDEEDLETEGDKSIVTALQSCTKLTDLQLTRQRLTAAELGLMLQPLTQLINLELDHFPALVDLSWIEKVSPTLKQLSLSKVPMEEMSDAADLRHLVALEWLVSDSALDMTDEQRELMGTVLPNLRQFDFTKRYG